MADWEVGDLALCVKGGRVTKSGCVYTVSAVAPFGAPCGCGNPLEFSSVHLLVDGHTEPDARGCEPWASSIRFRKVTPDESDEFDRETIALMNRAPAKEPSNA